MALIDLPPSLTRPRGETARRIASRIGEGPSALLYFVVWTAIATYPLVRAPFDHIENWGDPLLNVWIMAWDLHQLARDPIHLFNAPIFYPAPGTLALSELLLAQAIEALPVVALTGNFVFAYNVIVLLTFVGCGYGAYLLAREALPPIPSLVAGSVYAYSFFRVGEYSHVQVLSAQWIPLAILALLRLLRKPTWLGALALAAWVSLQALSSFYLGLFLLPALVFVLIYGLAGRRRPPTRAILLRLGGAALLTTLIVLPFSLPYFDVARQFQLERTLDDAIGGSATIRNYLAVPAASLFYGRLTVPPLQHMVTDETLFPGLIPLALALVGLVRPGRRKWAVLFLGLTLVGAIFSFGPRLHLWTRVVPGAILPYDLLYQFVPGFHSIRVVGRMGVITTLGIAGLAGLGAAAALARLPSRYQRAVGLLLVLAVSVETLSIPTRMTPVETPAQVPAVYRWLAARPDDAPALELPTIESRWLAEPSELERQGHEQYLSMYDWHPSPSGYSGFEPSRFWTVIREAKDFPTAESESFFQCSGVRYFIFHEDQYPPSRWQQILARLDVSGALHRRAQFGNDLVYTLDVPPITAASPPPRVLLPSAVPSGGSYRGFLDWSWGNPPSRLANPSELDVRATWSGPAELTATTRVNEPSCLVQGDTTAALDLPTPDRSGTYDLSVQVGGTTTRQTVQVIASAPPPAVAPSSTALQLQEARLVTAATRPGGTVFVAGSWQMRHPSSDNYLLALDVVDHDGKIVASGTEDPFLGDLPTSRWISGEVVPIEQSAILPRDLAPGSYEIRLRVRFADGASWPIVAPNGQDLQSVTIGQVQVG